MDSPNLESQHAKRLWLAVPLMCFWLAGIIYAFWWFQVRDLRSFDSSSQNQMAVFAVGQLTEKLRSLQDSQAQGETGQALVIHFWNPECNCNRFNNPHVRKIIDDYRSKGVRFITVAQTLPGQDSQRVLAQAQEIFGVPAMMDTKLILASASTPTVSPAAAVIRPDGELAYYGPYSDGAFCGANGSAFVEKALDIVLEGQLHQQLNTLAYGCFCQWNSTLSAHSI